MKVCLVRPPSIVNPVAYIASLTPPIGLAYIAASAREAGHEVSILDAIGENPFNVVPISDDLVLRGLSFEDIVEKIPEDTEVIGISGMFSSEWVQIQKLVTLITKRFPEIPMIAGGEHFTAAPELSVEQCPGIRAVVLGEGEETFNQVLDALSNGHDLENVAGLYYKKDGKDVFTKTRPRIRDVDKVPLPSWDLVPLEAYLSNSLSYGVNRGRSMPMLASRGCPYQCTFCSNPRMWTTRWLARDPKSLVDEIEDYKKRYRIENVDFYDLTAIVQKDWIISFSKELVERNVNITWQLPSGTRSEAIDHEVSQWLYRSGCRNLNYAPESGSERTLVKIKKRIKLSKLIDSLKGAVRAKLNVKTNIIIGLPDETHMDIWKTIWFLVRLSWHGAHDVSIGVFAPYPGSELYDRLVKEKVITHSNEYWTKLAYVDISETVSYCPNISSRMLRIYNWVGFAVFYGTNYLFRPTRFFRTLRNLAKNEHESRGEMALAALLSRLRIVRSAKQV